MSVKGKIKDITRWCHNLGVDVVVDLNRVVYMWEIIKYESVRFHYQSLSLLLKLSYESLLWIPRPKTPRL